MAQVLRVDAGETHTTVEGATETYARGEIQGHLVTEGHTVFTGEEPADLDVGTEIDLPMALDFRDMDVGTSIFLVGILALPLAGARMVDNTAAVAAVGLSIVVLILSGLYGLGLELFYLFLSLAVVLLVIGLIFRWSR